MKHAIYKPSTAICSLILTLGISVSGLTSAACSGARVTIKNQLTQHATTFHYPAATASASDNSTTIDVEAGKKREVCMNAASQESYFTGTDDSGNTYQTRGCGPLPSGNNKVMGVTLDTTPGPDQNTVVCFIN